MTTYAITGAYGFLGWHLRCRLKAVQPEAEVRLLGRGDLDDSSQLANRLEGCNTVFHLAAVNSHDPEAAASNVHLSEQLVAGLSKLGSAPHVVYSNSSAAMTGSEYGRAKKMAAEVLQGWKAASGGTLADVLLPNLFGEGARPHYNSVVATFCHAVVNAERPHIDPNGRSELLHVQEAGSRLLRHAAKRRDVQERVDGHTLAVPELYERLVRFHDLYHSAHTVPPLTNKLDLRLFNQLRSVMFPDAYPVRLVTHADPRGTFFEAVRDSGNGQTSFSTTAPGVRRGDHWHFDKLERFLVLRGRAVIEIRRLFDDAVIAFETSGNDPAFVDMPTLHTHSITNIGDGELLTMFWTAEHFDPDDPDTHMEPVHPKNAVTT